MVSKNIDKVKNIINKSKTIKFTQDETYYVLNMCDKELKIIEKIGGSNE